MKIKRLFSCMLAIAVLVTAPAFAQDGTTSPDAKKPPETKQKRTKPHPERHGVRTVPTYGCPEPGASCSVSCPNGNGSIRCRVGEVCECSCSGGYPNCSCD